MSTYSSLPRAESLLTLQRRVPSLCILAARLLFANAWHVDSWREPGGERNGAWSFASLCGHASVVQPHGACVQSLFHHLPKCRPDRGRMTSSGEETSEQTREETIRNVESEYHEINSKCAWPMIYQVRKGAGRGRRKKGKEREKERKGETVRSSAAISVSGGTARLPRAGYSLSLSLSLPRSRSSVYYLPESLLRLLLSHTRLFPRHIRVRSLRGRLLAAIVDVTEGTRIKTAAQDITSRSGSLVETRRDAG